VSDGHSNGHRVDDRGESSQPAPTATRLPSAGRTPWRTRILTSMTTQALVRRPEARTSVGHLPGSSSMLRSLGQQHPGSDLDADRSCPRC